MQTTTPDLEPLLQALPPQARQLVAAALPEAAKTLSPQALSGWVGGVKLLLDAGAGMGPIVTYLRTLPGVVDEAGEARLPEIVAHESTAAPEIAGKLVSIGERSRNLKGHGLEEGISTRMLIYAGQLIARGVEPVAACNVALVRPITDDADIRDALDAAVKAYF